MQKFRYRITSARKVLQKGTLEAKSAFEALRNVCQKADNIGPKAVSLYVEKVS